MTPSSHSILAGIVPGGPELIVILLIVVLLFGATKLPQLAKGIGQSIKEFKKASKDGAESEPAEPDLKAELAAAKAEIAAAKAAKRDDAAKTHGSN
jgi:sec-independent protein translocase protein TatA